MPAHHKLEAFLDEYIRAAGTGDDNKSPLLRSALGRTGLLNGEAMHRIDAWRMIQRRAAELGMKVKIGCHTFRATGITAYLEAGGTLENAQMMAAHESPRTTKLYDRTGDAITLDEVERITIQTLTPKPAEFASRCRVFHLQSRRKESRYCRQATASASGCPFGAQKEHWRRWRSRRPLECLVPRPAGQSKSPRWDSSYSSAALCSPQKPYGQLSTSRSSISTLQPSRSSTQKSPTNASLSSSSPNKSNHAPISIGGQSQSSRINYPEVV
jgi:Phage integrase family